MIYNPPEKSPYPLKKELTADFREPPQPLASDIDARIAKALGVPVAPFTTSMDAAFALKDTIFEGWEYVNVDFREYYIDGQMSFICDIKTENGEEARGHGRTRPRALIASLISYVDLLILRRDEALGII